MRLSAIVVTYRQPELLEGCLESVRRATAGIDGETEIVVVDNDPASGIVRRATERLQGLRVLEMDGNVGFAGGMVAGSRACRGRWIAVVNDDATVASDAFELMVEAGERAPDIGSVAAQVRFADRPDAINSAGITVDAVGVAADRCVGLPAGTAGGEPTEVFGASGTVALYRSAMLDDVGGFDGSFFAYLEDVDVAWRARMRGWRCVLEPRALAWHRHAATSRHGSPFKHRLVGRNRMRLLAKNMPTRQLLSAAPAIVGYEVGYVAYAMAADRTFAPVQGRVAGLREWRRYRRLGSPTRRPLPLPPPGGFRAALRRHAAWRAGD